MLFCCVNFVVLTTWTLTMDHLQKLNGLDPMEIGNDDSYDRCDYLDPDSNADILLNNDSDLNIVQFNIRGLISNKANCAMKSKVTTTATWYMCSFLRRPG